MGENGKECWEIEIGRKGDAEGESIWEEEEERCR